MATAEAQYIVDQLNAGTTTVLDLVKLYPSFSADEIQRNWDAINKENNYVAPGSSDSDEGFDIMGALGTGAAKGINNALWKPGQQIFIPVMTDACVKALDIPGIPSPSPDPPVKSPEAQPVEAPQETQPAGEEYDPEDPDTW